MNKSEDDDILLKLTDYEIFNTNPNTNILNTNQNSILHTNGNSGIMNTNPNVNFNTISSSSKNIRNNFKSKRLNFPHLSFNSLNPNKLMKTKSGNFFVDQFTITPKNPSIGPSPNKKVYSVKSMSSQNKSNIFKSDLDQFFHKLDKYNKETNLNNNKNISSFKTINLQSPRKNNFNFQNIYNLSTNPIWSNFLNTIEKTLCNALVNNRHNNYINNINISKQNVINNNSEMIEIKSKLEEKEMEIKELQNKLKNLEIKKHSDNNLNNSKNDHDNEHNEIIEYSNKQLLRDFKSLSNENKNLRENVKILETEINLRKGKEMKIMQLLYYLNKKGIPIEEIIDKEITSSSNKMEIDFSKNKEDSIHEESKSFDSSIFLPITLDMPKKMKKLEMIPQLNLKNINDKYNSEYNTISPNKKNKIIDDKQTSYINNQMSTNPNEKVIKKSSNNNINSNFQLNGKLKLNLQSKLLNSESTKKDLNINNLQLNTNTFSTTSMNSPDSIKNTLSLTKKPEIKSGHPLPFQIGNSSALTNKVKNLMRNKNTKSIGNVNSFDLKKFIN